MISKIFIITIDGDLCYSRTFMKKDIIEDDAINIFVAIHNISKKIGGGNILSLNFADFNVIYSYDEYGYIYIIIADNNDLEIDLRRKIDLLKREFCDKYQIIEEKLISKTKGLKLLDDFIERNVFIHPSILLTGETGVGKSTIMDLFPGETILELDNDMNEIIQKTINLPNLEGLTEFILREVNLQELIGYSKIYKTLLDSADIICIVTNSGAGNLSRTKQFYSELKQKTNKADFFMIANFQDLLNTSFEPDKISESFNIKTFGFSAVRADAKDVIYKIINTILKISIIDKIEKKYNHFI